MEQEIDERLQQAAEEYINLPHSCLEYSDDGWEDKTDWEFVERAFKAGAEWMASQGIVRVTDAFIDKACEWLANTDFCHYYNREFIEEFKNYMKG